MIVLRDGRHLVGIFRSFDQFSNMVLEQTSERRILHAKIPPPTTHPTTPHNPNNNPTPNTVVCYYTDVQLGLYLVRGDSMVLLGEVDDDDDDIARAEPQSTRPADGADVPVSGSGLLRGGKVGDLRKDGGRTRMERVSLEEFERLEKRFGEDGGRVDALTWEFDLDVGM